MQNKTPCSFWGAQPLLQRYNFRISPSPQQILDPPLRKSTGVIQILSIIGVFAACKLYIPCL